MGQAPRLQARFHSSLPPNAHATTATSTDHAVVWCGANSVSPVRSQASRRVGGSGAATALAIDIVIRRRAAGLARCQLLSGRGLFMTNGPGIANLHISLCLFHTHARTHTHTRMHARTHIYTLALTHTHKLTTHSLSLSHTHTHAIDSNINRHAVVWRQLCQCEGYS